GEIVSIIGPSGSGKSTLIRCVHMLETYDSGAVYLSGEQLGFEPHGDGIRARTSKEIAAQRAQMGMVFQQFNLFPHMTVLENITDAAIRVKGISKADAVAEARRLLGLVRLSEKETSYPRQLSGGQQQRVAIARALAMKPELLLFDEPTSALDPETVGEVLSVMREVAKLGSTMIVVTHEIEFAREVADRIVFMESGRIVEQGPPAEILGNPSPRLAAFLRSEHAEG
ncbi:MAG: amino acid ABC transporter ATP-binding protein, partial [Microbacteriaceae bacterium]|nr:amino acid ABC transporter ATP-binding protein [Microbacteriaceae bacterium]